MERDLSRNEMLMEDGHGNEPSEDMAIAEIAAMDKLIADISVLLMKNGLKDLVRPIVDIIWEAQWKSRQSFERQAGHSIACAIYEALRTSDKIEQLTNINKLLGKE